MGYEEEMFCPECGGGAEFVTEDGDLYLRGRLIWCARCKAGFNVQSGEKVRNWVENAVSIQADYTIRKPEAWVKKFNELCKKYPADEQAVVVEFLDYIEEFENP